MLSEKNEIDQLFSRKLGQFDETPPASVWDGINKRLIYRSRLRSGLKAGSIAATIVLAALAGWWVNNPSGKPDIRVKQAAVQTDKNTIKEQSTNNLQLSVNDDKSASENPSKVNKIQTSNRSLQAFITANTPVIAGDDPVTNPDSRDQFVTLPDTKKPLNSQSAQADSAKTTLRILVTENNDYAASSVTEGKPTVSSTSKMISPDEATGVPAFHRNLKRNKRWSLKAEFAPVLSNRPQNNVQISELNSSDSRSSNVKINSENSYSAGILAGFKVSKRISVRSGVAYRNLRQSGQNNDDNYLKRQFEYAEVPVQASCKLAESRLGVSITGGFSAAYLIGNREVISVNDEQTSRGKTAGMQSLTYSGLLGLEIGYDITKHLTITVEPRLRHDLNSLSAFNSVNYKADHLEIATGLTYCFD